PNELSGGQQQRVAIACSLVNEPFLILADEPTGNLDSKSKIEILTILQQLNEKGKTVIVVTHENEIADHAKRIIKMRDGRIISDELNCKEPGKCDTKVDDKLVQEALSKEQKFYRQAEFLDYMRQAASAMWSHKMRTFLSVLGILIGVAAVIAMLALGQGAQETISKQLSSLGSNLLLVMPGSARIQGIAMATGTVTRFTFQDVAAIDKMTESINRSYPSVQGRGQLVYGNKNWNTQLEGDGVDYAEMRSAVPTIGRFFTDDEVKMRNKVAVIGLTVARNLFGDENPVGKTMKINLINFKVIGVLPEKGATGWRDQDDVVIVPVTTAMYRVFGKEYIDSIFVEVRSPDLIEDTQDAITKLIIKQHRLSKDNEDTFQIRNMA
ncbi:MAG: ABC transporter permease, partial [Candidatus Omnitrophota bacterium]|nr:ABC transporter permease [Candidatus Omnitrophota bacterium]